ncbi:hypothetical protein BD410DRAFT_829788 [Rickenella mellea]|uniref:Uncharacterized protein n=1 Tax=Rickenella mellea TaxID=50990 RepID=A0A4Y7PY49_9AGAM|nr:hypothetical protein BD410DRAFT_829788 [Rickenella mellea]
MDEMQELSFSKKARSHCFMATDVDVSANASAIIYRKTEWMIPPGVEIQKYYAHQKKCKSPDYGEPAESHVVASRCASLLTNDDRRNQTGTGIVESHQGSARIRDSIDGSGFGGEICHKSDDVLGRVAAVFDVDSATYKFSSMPGNFCHFGNKRTTDVQRLEMPMRGFLVATSPIQQW